MRFAVISLAWEIKLRMKIRIKIKAPE